MFSRFTHIVYLCHVFKNKTAAKDNEKGREKQKKAMKATVLSKVSTERLDILLDAITSVMQEMEEIIPDRDALLDDHGYSACVMLSYVVFASFKGQVLGETAED